MRSVLQDYLEDNHIFAFSVVVAEHGKILSGGWHRGCKMVLLTF
jgi:hypothetical protein